MLGVMATVARAWRASWSWITRLIKDPANAELAVHKIRHTKVLQENADRYRAIVDTAVDAIIVTDRFGKIESFNRTAEAIFGYEASDVIGQSVGTLLQAPYPTADGDPLDVYRAAEKRIAGIGREIEGKRKDGSTVPLELSVAEWFDVNGHQCFTGIMRDATSRRMSCRSPRKRPSRHGSRRRTPTPPRPSSWR
jgi:PAS domain S-box-containing protein